MSHLLRGGPSRIQKRPYQPGIWYSEVRRLRIRIVSQGVDCVHSVGLGRPQHPEIQNYQDKVGDDKTGEPHKLTHTTHTKHNPFLLTMTLLGPTVFWKMRQVSRQENLELRVTIHTRI